MYRVDKVFPPRKNLSTKNWTERKCGNFRKLRKFNDKFLKVPNAPNALRSNALSSTYSITELAANVEEVSTAIFT